MPSISKNCTLPVKFLLAASLSLLLTACSDSGDRVLIQEKETPATDTVNGELIAMRLRLQSLQQQAQILEDTNAIKRLQRSFGYYMSEGLWDDVSELFTDTASWEFARDGVYQGKQRIRAYLSAMHDGEEGLKEGQLNEYLQLMPVITLADDGLSAKGRWRSIMMLGQQGEAAFWGEGPYENDYVKEDGVWKMSKLRWFQTILVPYKGAWGHSEDVNKGIWVSDQLPPDGPPTSDEGTWPTTFLPPFSFENPVGTYEAESALQNTAENVTGGEG